MKAPRLFIPWALLIVGSVCADAAQAFTVGLSLAAAATAWASACFVGGFGG